MNSVEVINDLLKNKNSELFKKYLVDAEKYIRDENIKYKLLDCIEPIKKEYLDPLLIKISDIKEFHEIFIESLVGMDKKEFDNYLLKLDRKKKLKYIIKNIDIMNYNCNFEARLIEEFIYYFENRKKSIKDLFVDTKYETDIYIKCITIKNQYLQDNLSMPQKISRG